jgi:transposase
MKAYSVDLRQKIVEVYKTEKISQSELAKRFRVAKSFVQKMLKQWREYGHLNPKPHGGGHSLKLSSAHLILIGDWVQDKNDITLKEIQARLEGQEKIKVSLATILQTFIIWDLSKR